MLIEIVKNWLHEKKVHLRRNNLHISGGYELKLPAKSKNDIVERIPFKDPLLTCSTVIVNISDTLEWNKSGWKLETKSKFTLLNLHTFTIS